MTASVKEESNFLLASEVGSPELKFENFSATLQIKIESEYGEASVSPPHASETESLKKRLILHLENMFFAGNQCEKSLQDLGPL